MKSSSNASDYVGSIIKQISRKHKKALMGGIRHDTMHCNYKTGNNIGAMKFILKVKENNDEYNKLVVINACEENVPKFITRYCKRQIKSAMVTSSKSKLMSTNTKK